MVVGMRDGPHVRAEVAFCAIDQLRTRRWDGPHVRAEVAPTMMPRWTFTGDKTKSALNFHSMSLNMDIPESARHTAGRAGYIR